MSSRGEYTDIVVYTSSQTKTDYLPGRYTLFEAMEAYITKGVATEIHRVLRYTYYPKGGGFAPCAWRYPMVLDALLADAGYEIDQVSQEYGRNEIKEARSRSK